MARNGPIPSPGSALFEAIRDAASRRAWSRGVELVRMQAVTVQRDGKHDGKHEWELRVAEPGAVVARTVAFELADTTWDCDCGGDEDPCEHVAAAAIAWKRAQEGGTALADPDARGEGSLRYRLTREPGGLSLSRVVAMADGREEALAVRLRALAAGRVSGPRVRVNEIDLAIDEALDDPRGGRLTRAVLARVLPLLARSEALSLDGAPVGFDPEPVAPQGILEDHPGGFRLRVELLPGVQERIADGFVRCGDVLRPLRETRLSGRELEELPRGVVFAPERASELASEILPDLTRRIPVDVRTARLPRATARREPPRIALTTRRDGDALLVRADILYGEPARARIEGERLVPLGGELPLRDEAAERALARRVQSELGLPVGAELVLRDEEALVAAERLRGFPADVRGAAAHEFVRAAPIRPRLDTTGGRFDLWFETDPARTTAPAAPAAGGRAGAAAVVQAWREKRSLVALSEGTAGGGFGGLAPLPVDWLARHGRDVAALLEQRRADGSLPRAALPDLARLAAVLGAEAPAELGPLRALVDGFDAIPAAPLPTDLRAELRPYQRTGVDWLCFLRDAELGALLADDMGLGKTLQILAALPEPGRGRTLVVCPTSVLDNWAEELRRFRPGLSVCLHRGPGRRLDPGADVTVTSYALLRIDADALAAATWDIAILDEAQAIKNPDSQTARAAYGLRARWRVAVTGTPVENRLAELWSQMQFANPGLLGSLASFQERWARPIEAGEPGVAASLRQRLRPFVLRRTKRVVAPELPARTERVLRCELDAEERAVYDAILAATRRDVVERVAAGGNPLAILEALLRLRQAACHRGLIPGQTAERSSKLDLLFEELETAVAEGHKALVFSQWTSLLDRVEPGLRSAGIAWTRLDGSTRDRAGVIARFQDEAGPPVLLVSLQAGGTGLNLTAADHVFLLDPWWNPAVEDQAADRAHRIGQTRPVEIHRLVAADTVEERVLALQQHKRQLATAALSDAARATTLTRQDLLALLD
ncbi:MAG: DEAD/DEAH box helicase [Myxococcota bacterium]|nr:DEAD/DEAH box helicase [Myxococcota bacterium]